MGGERQLVRALRPHGSALMTAPFDPQSLLTALADHRVDYVLIGGLAAVLHGSTAMTNDADIFPAPDEANLERLAGALRELGARIRAGDPDGVDFDPHPALLKSITVLNLTTRFGDLDLAAQPTGLPDHDDVAERATTMEVGELDVLVASLDDIIRSKEAADRPKDRATLPILHALADEIERSGD